MNKQGKISVGVLTSSRADYGIYRPLLSLLSKDPDIELVIFAFGMHLQEQHGLTLQYISEDAFGKVITVEGMSEGDSRFEITQGYSKLIEKFASIWDQNEYDFILALGDRFEMSAAVQSTIPFGLRLVHIHAGETTLGANDEIYRHQITLASEIFFVSTAEYGERVEQLKGANKNIYNLGALSLDNIKNLELPEWSEVCSRFELPQTAFILITFHPETAGSTDANIANDQMILALSALTEKYHLIITLPNADHQNNKLRARLYDLKADYPTKVSLIKSFGKLPYFSAIKESVFLLGNTSSGIIEAASFGKHVINVGDRQKGRAQSENVVNVGFSVEEILRAVEEIERYPKFNGLNIYEGLNTARKMVEILKNCCFGERL